MEYIHRDLEGKIRELSEDYSFGIIEIRTVMRLIWYLNVMEWYIQYPEAKAQLSV